MNTTVTFIKKLDGKQTEIQCFIGEGCAVFAQTDKGKEQIHFANEHGQEYIKFLKTVSIKGVEIEEIAITKEEKSELEKVFLYIYGENESNKKEKFGEFTDEKKVMLLYSHEVGFELENLPREIRDMVKKLDFEDVKDKIALEVWGTWRSNYVVVLEYKELCEIITKKQLDKEKTKQKIVEMKKQLEEFHQLKATLKGIKAFI